MGDNKYRFLLFVICQPNHQTNDYKSIILLSQLRKIYVHRYQSLHAHECVVLLFIVILVPTRSLHPYPTCLVTRSLKAGRIMGQPADNSGKQFRVAGC